MTNRSQKTYDYIFLGTGCATLSILMRMISSGKFTNSNFLLIDKGPKNKNDRTWCFWEKEKGYFEDLVHKKWSALLFNSGSLSCTLDIAPYEYKMIRGIDFYNYCFSIISAQPNIETRYSEITFETDTAIKIDGEALTPRNAVVFNSIYHPAKKEKDKFYLLQHFKGWIIETTRGSFNPDQGTLMDFNTSQDVGTSFVYVLPLSTSKALVEYTLFTESLLQPEEYDIRLREYIEQQLKINNFTIAEEEYGIIPMTNANFAAYENGMYNIGTAGGQTKGSTGYTFRFIQKHASQIVEDILLKKEPPKTLKRKKKFDFYDSTLLNILSGRKLEGKEIFTRLFQKNKAADVFTFLDNESNLHQELRIINSLPKKQFLAAGLQEIVKMIT